MKQAVAVAIAVGLLASTLVASRAEHRRAVSLAASLETIPTTMDGWVMTKAETLTPDELGQLRATEYILRMYRRDGDVIQLVVAHYASQSAGIGPHAPEDCLIPTMDFRKTDPVAIVVDGRATKINRIQLRDGQRELLLFYWYQTRQRLLRDEYARKFYLAWDALTGGDTSGALVQIIALNGPGVERSALRFAEAVVLEVQRCLGRSDVARADALIGWPVPATRR